MVTKDKSTPREQQAAQVNQTTGAPEKVVIDARPLNPPEEQTKAGSTREAHQRHHDALEAERKRVNATPAKVDTSETKIIPTIGQPRAQTSEEIRQDQEDAGRRGSVAKAYPYPGDPTEGHVRAIALSERQRDATEFDTSDLTGTSVDGDGKTDTVIVRLLVDWWDGQGVRHPLNSRVEMPMNDARNMIDQRKAERTDPLR